MNIRKEQVLFLVTLALVVWLASTFEVGKKPRRRSPGTKPDVTFSGRDAILVDPAAAPSAPRELFLKPSESRPLEPRQDLPFPEMAPLPTVMLPLPYGQHPGALSDLRRSIPMIKGPAPGGDGSASSQGDPQDGNGAPGNPTPSGEGDPADRYDSLVLVGQASAVYYGLILNPEADKYRWGRNKNAGAQETVRFQWIDPESGKWNPELTKTGAEIKELRLAKTLRNEVGMASVGLVPAQHNIQKQREFILWLLEKARLESWVFAAALERARVYQTFVTPKEEGLLYVAKVLRAKGDLEAELALFKDIDKSLQGSSFQLRGLGLVEARLGLDKLAEQHLRDAVRINTPIDPRNYAALAEFLLDRGRAKDAAEFARKAFDFRTRRDPTKAEQVGFLTLQFRAQLAVGDLEGAEATLSQNSSLFAGEKLGVENNYLGACLAYARLDFENAATGFQTAYSSGFVPDALLGLAASKFGKGEVAGALSDFAKVGDDSPRVRDLAFAGSGLVLSHIEGEGANALEQIDASLVTNPIRPYTLYLKGRQLRRSGDRQGAIAALKMALKRQDDFIEALAELTETYFQEYQANRDASSLVSAIRYVDRLVELDQKHGEKDVLFLEKQGRIYFEARDFRGARKAFTAGDAAGSLYCGIGLALIDYVQKRSDRSEDRLQRIIRNLAPDDPTRKHITDLLNAMIDHANKEQVIDTFAGSLGRVWEKKGAGRLQPRSKDGVLRFKGKPSRYGAPMHAFRVLDGPGRFVELSIDVKVASPVDFAGIVVEIPGVGANPSRFRIALGCNQDGKIEFQIRDGGTGTKQREPIRTDIVVTKNEWHGLRFATHGDPSNPKSSNLFLRATFDGQTVFDEKVRGIRRAAGSGRLRTGVEVMGQSPSPVDVEFRKFRRVQYQN